MSSAFSASVVTLNVVYACSVCSTECSGCLQYMRSFFCFLSHRTSRSFLILLSIRGCVVIPYDLGKLAYADLKEAFDIVRQSLYGGFKAHYNLHLLGIEHEIVGD